MATTQFTRSVNDRAWSTEWSSLASGQTGDAASLMGRLCAQISGTFGTGTVSLQGSNDGSTWVTLTDSLGADISAVAANDVVDILEGVLYVRPVVSGGDGTTAIKVLILAQC